MVDKIYKGICFSNPQIQNSTSRNSTSIKPNTYNILPASYKHLIFSPEETCNKFTTLI